MELLKKIQRKLWKTFFRNARLSYSQSGEDMILDTIFGNIKDGFYVDIGANNPYVQSNTYFFYKKGWKGINVDALPGTKRMFDKARPRDINIEAGIDNKENEIRYFMFKSSFYNTFNELEAERKKQIIPFKGVKTIKTILLSSLLDQYKVTNIDYLSVDVEGFDLNVLQSNDWNKWRPKIIITEFFSEGLDQIFQDPVFLYLKSKDYIYLCNSATNAFYIESSYYSQRFIK